MSEAMAAAPEPAAPEVAVSLDMVRRGVFAAPLLVAVCALVWGADGAFGSLYAIALVLANFLLSAGIISVASRISPAAVLGGVLFGYLFRLGLLFVAVYLVRGAAWISLPAVGTSILVTHLGLLFWELKYVALTLAHPGLKPHPPASP